MNLKDNLEVIGIPRPASTIYIALIELRSGTISEIAGKTNLYRPLVYKNIQFLIGRGLVSKVKKGKRWIYIPESPIRLESLLEESSVNAKKIIADITDRFSKKSREIDISYHEGKKAIRKVFEEIILKSKKDDTIYRFESPSDYKKNAKYYPDIYWKKATGQISDINKKVITNEKTANLRTKNLSRETRSVPNSFDKFEYNITELITKDLVGFIDYDSETALVIRGKRFGEFQAKIFDLLFKKLQ